MTSKKGFTLIELLVVIAIIAILAAILFPVFAQAREKARAITCVSNEKQMGLAMMMYVEDYDETFPMLQYYDNNGNPYDWYNGIQPYVKNGTTVAGADNVGQIAYGEGGIWQCPDYPRPGDPAIYGVNFCLSHDGAGTYSSTLAGFALHTCSLAALNAPSDLFMVVEKGAPADVAGQTYTYGGPDFDPAESNWTNPIGPFVNGEPTKADTANYMNYDFDCGLTDTTARCQNWTGPGDMPRFRHTGNTNVLFADGHVKLVHPGGVEWYKNVYVQGQYEVLPDGGTPYGPPS